MDNILVGAFGWDYEQWHEQFYPEDLPEDWRLDFYANMYRTAIVPQAVWQAWDEDDIEDIEEAIEGEFYFYFECAASEFNNANLDKLNQLIESLQRFAAGIVICDELDRIEDASQIDEMQSAFDLPVTLISTSRKLSGWSWQAPDSKWICSGSPLGVIERLTNDAKQQTQLLRDFEASLPEDNKAAAFIIRDENLAMAQLNNLKVIAELLGF